MFYGRNGSLGSVAAAEYLGMSQPTLVKLLDEGEIPFKKVGGHRRVILENFIAYENSARQNRRGALDALTAEAMSDGTYFNAPDTSASR